jgi:PAS domain S-box-containing protein
VEQRRASESEAAYRALVSQAVVGMSRYNLRGQLVFVNQAFCEMLGYRRSELIDRPILQMTHPNDVTESRRLLRQMVRNSRPYQIEKRYLRKDGSILWAIVSASPLRDEKGRTEGVIAAIVDVSERKRAQAALEDANILLESRVTTRTQDLLAANEALQNQIALSQLLESQLLEISEREKRRLGQELHDSLCQHLTAVAFMARAVGLRLKDHRVIEFEDLDRIAELINEGVTEARAIARGLYPVDMDTAGLVAALQGLVNQRTLPVRSRLEADEEVPISDPNVALHLYRIAHEAVINANKHGGAREIVVRMRRARDTEDQIELSITDDGVGFRKNGASIGGMGIQMMNYRARAIGAVLQIETIKPHGTRVRCRVALK